MSDCLLCGEDVTERPSVLVDFEGRPREVCTDCLEKGDLDELEPRVDLNREGDPAFNGAFNVW